MRRHELERDAVLSQISNLVTAPKTKDGKPLNAETAKVAAAAGMELVYDDSAVIISDNQVRAGKGLLCIAWRCVFFASARNVSLCCVSYILDRSTASPRFQVPLCVSFQRLWTTRGLQIFF